MWSFQYVMSFVMRMLNYKIVILGFPVSFYWLGIAFIIAELLIMLIKKVT